MARLKDRTTSSKHNYHAKVLFEWSSSIFKGLQRFAEVMSKMLKIVTRALTMMYVRCKTKINKAEYPGNEILLVNTVLLEKGSRKKADLPCPQ